MVDTSGTTPTKNGSNTHLPQAKQERIVQPSPGQGKMSGVPFCFFGVFFAIFQGPLAGEASGYSFLELKFHDFPGDSRRLFPKQISI